MACQDGVKLRGMIDACFMDELFSKSLKDSIFASFLEVLKNSKKKAEKLFFKKNQAWIE